MTTAEGGEEAEEGVVSGPPAPPVESRLEEEAEPAIASSRPRSFPGRLAALDGIRALAIMMVIVFHTTSIVRLPLPWLGPFATPVVHGWMGVDLFFGMSGFLITRLWLEEEISAPAEPAGSRTKRFFGRRALRILPIYYVTLILFLLTPLLVKLPSVVPFARRVAKDPTTLLSYVFFFVNYVSYGKDGAFAARWSLCVEEHFYLLWPCVLLFARSRRSRLTVGLVVCALILAARTYAIPFGDHRHGLASYMMIRYASHFRIDSILWGCIVALGYERLLREPQARRVALGVSSGLVVVLIAMGELSILHPPTMLGSGIGSSIIAIASALLAAEVTAAPSSWLGRSLAVRPLATIGFHSYAMYLVHPVAIDIAIEIVRRTTTEPTVWHLVLTMALTIVISLLLAMLLYATVERPFRALRARLRVPSTIA